MFYKEGVLGNFANIGKHRCESLFFNKVADFVKKETLAQVFSCKFCTVFKNSFLIFIRWLLPLLLLSNAEMAQSNVDSLT